MSDFEEDCCDGEEVRNLKAAGRILEANVEKLWSSDREYQELATQRLDEIRQLKADNERLREGIQKLKDENDHLRHERNYLRCEVKRLNGGDDA